MVLDKELVRRIDAYVKDRAVYVADKKDEWNSYAKELRESKDFVLRGDCDDWASTCIHLLEMEGAPKNRLFRAMVSSPQAANGKIDHMIGLVQTDDGTMWSVGDTFGPPAKVKGLKVHPHVIVQSNRIDEHDEHGDPLWREWD